MARTLKFFLAFFLCTGLWQVPAHTYPHNTVLLDCGRKYYTIGWIHSLIDAMAQNHANELILHFSDNMGLRIESRQYPWLAGSDNAFSLDPSIPDPDEGKIYTQEEIKDLIEYGRKRGVALIPGFDSPGHLHYVLDRYKAHFGRDIAMADHPDWLDLEDASGVAFIRSLIAEYAVLFQSDQFDIGGDEVQMDQAAFVSYLNQLDDMLHGYGISQCRVFSDGIKPGLHPDIATAYWQLDLPTPRTIGQEHEVINCLNFYLYDVLDPDLVFVGADPAAIRREFAPAWFCGWPADPETVTGSCLCIWSDIPGSQTEEEVMEGFVPLLEAWGEKNGGGLLVLLRTE